MIGTIIKKELLELVRDKKTLFFTLFFPTVLMPLIIIGLLEFSSHQVKKAQKEPLKYAIVHSEQLPEVALAFKKQNDFNLIQLKISDKNIIDHHVLKSFVDEGVVDFILWIPSDAKQLKDNHQSIPIQLHFNDASLTNQIYQRVENNLSDLKQSLREDYLIDFGLSEKALADVSHPLILKKVNTANAREDQGEKIGGILPYLILSICILGALYPALDLGVGEKERGTLETLLVSPIARSQLVIAKFCVISLCGFLAVFFQTLAFGAWIMGYAYVKLKTSPELVNQVKEQSVSVSQNIDMIGVWDISLILILLLPTVAIFASTFLAVSIYSRSYKEAQNYTSYFFIVLFLPVSLSLMPGVELNWFWSSIPLTNIALAIKEIFKGTIEYPMLGMIMLSSLLLAGLLLWLCTRWFHREDVLFRS